MLALRDWIIKQYNKIKRFTSMLKWKIDLYSSGNKIQLTDSDHRYIFNQIIKNLTIKEKTKGLTDQDLNTLLEILVKVNIESLTYQEITDAKNLLKTLLGGDEEIKRYKKLLETIDEMHNKMKGINYYIKRREGGSSNNLLELLNFFDKDNATNELEERNRFDEDAVNEGDKINKWTDEINELKTEINKRKDEINKRKDEIIELEHEINVFEAVIKDIEGWISGWKAQIKELEDKTPDGWELRRELLRKELDTCNEVRSILITKQEELFKRLDTSVNNQIKLVKKRNKLITRKNNILTRLNKLVARLNRLVKRWNRP